MLLAPLAQGDQEAPAAAALAATSFLCRAREAAMLHTTEKVELQTAEAEVAAAKQVGLAALKLEWAVLAS
jgi:hypothetical protein